MPKILSKVADFQAVLSRERAAKKTVGFVPTMGALHAGHLSLMARARQENDISVASIFVNPTQFNDKKDYALYPRDVAKDAAMLDRVGCEIVFAPDEAEVYPDGGMKNIEFVPGKLGEILEGAHRPGHFAGVAAVVKRLLDTAQPDKAYFGQKDYQQYLIIRKMAEQFRLPVKIVLCATVREGGGLAMSSRNERLSPDGRKKAQLISGTLQESVEKVKAGRLTLKQIREDGAGALKENGNFEVDYFDICSADDLHSAGENERNRPLIICAAATLEGVRLIDNMLV